MMNSSNTCTKHLGYTLLNGFSKILLIIWPGVVWLMYYQPAYRPWLLGIVILLVFRIWFLHQSRSALRNLAIGGALMAIALGAGSIWLKSNHLLLYYPVGVNFLLFVWFFMSLWAGTPLIEQIARLRHKTLPAEAIPYTRKVTQVWCIFFVLNGLISLVTCLLNELPIWFLWNGVISYLLIGLLILLEWLIRPKPKKEVAHHDA